MKIFLNLLGVIMLIMVVNFVLCEFMMHVSSLKLFECGFDSSYWSHPKLSIHFFKMGIIFILFDLELMFLLLAFTKTLFVIWLLMMFIYWTVFLEIYLGGFKWSILSQKKTVNFL